MAITAPDMPQSNSSGDIASAKGSGEPSVLLDKQCKFHVCTFELLINK